MKKNLTLTLILIFLLIGCRSSDSDKNGRSVSDRLKADSMLHTGWYFISDSSTGFKRQLDTRKEVFNIDPRPIISAANFDEVSMFHEKDCYALIVRLDKKGSIALDIAREKAKGKQLAFILDNKLVRTQLVDDPQFAKVGNDIDPRVYGEVLAFPCNSVSAEEMKKYKAIMESKK